MDNTGSAQELVTAGEATGGMMYYALGEDAATAPADDLYATSVPTATDAGTYYVWYKAVGDDNHVDSEAACIEVSIYGELVDISKATIEFVDEKDTLIYDGTEQTIGYTLKVEDVTLKKDTDYKIYEGDESKTEPGTYIIKIEGIGGYTGETKVLWYIIPKPITVYVGEQKVVETSDCAKPITVTAPEAETGKRFSHWTLGTSDGEIVSYSEKYSFILKESVNLIPNYVDADVTVAPNTVLTLKASQTIYNGKKAIGYTFTHSVPSDYTVKEVGLLYATNKLAGADTTKTDYAKKNLTLEEDKEAIGYTNKVDEVVKGNTTGKVKSFVANYTKRNGTVSFSYAIGTNKEAYVYAVGYIKVTNSEGENETLYTNFVSTTYAGIG